MQPQSANTVCECTSIDNIPDPSPYWWAQIMLLRCHTQATQQLSRGMPGNMEAWLKRMTAVRDGGSFRIHTMDDRLSWFTYRVLLIIETVWKIAEKLGLLHSEESKQLLCASKQLLHCFKTTVVATRDPDMENDTCYCSCGLGVSRVRDQSCGLSPFEHVKLATENIRLANDV